MRVSRTAHVLPTAPLANNPCPCPLRHLRGLVSPGSAPALPVSRLPLPPWQVRVGDPQAASATPFYLEQHPNYTQEEKEAGVPVRYLQNPDVKVLQLGRAS